VGCQGDGLVLYAFAMWVTNIKTFWIVEWMTKLKVKREW
jgi:hypothetical protein